MKTITVKEALKQGYTLCGYEDLEMQGLKNIDNLEEEDFEPHHGYLCVANKQSISASISSEEVIEWLTVSGYSLEEFVFKMNEVYNQKKWWFLDSDLRLVADENEIEP
jgi:hypothetical protein